MTFRLFGVLMLAGCLAGVVTVGPVSAQATKEDKKADEPKLGAAELLAKGLAELNKGDMVKASEYIEQAVKADPKNSQTVYIHAAISLNRGMQEQNKETKKALIFKAAAAARQLKANEKDLKDRFKQLYVMAIFTEAQIYSSEKDEAKAIASLNEAADAGFSDLDTINKEADFKSVRESASFAPLKAKIELAAKKAIEEMIAGVKQEMHAFKGFPFTFELPDLEDKKIKLADFKGKVTIVDVWGTWCPPCREEIPHFIALLEKYGKAKDGLAMVGINYERAEQSQWKKIISGFVKENKINYPCLIGDEKTQESIPEFEGFPTTLFIDRAGKVRFKLTGMAPPAVLESIVKLLLDEPAPKS
jgi:thiol-disulfide isomerase/thioredoxin